MAVTLYLFALAVVADDFVDVFLTQLVLSFDFLKFAACINEQNIVVGLAAFSSPRLCRWVWKCRRRCCR